ncbi:MAG: hypothetical protein OXF54_00130 [Caldilineaceae bacterium]|nr:hypothetical protein [Caldilineaceae bacterium]
MSYETTLFAHIAQWLTYRIEDVAVEALGHILSQSLAAREALTDALKDGCIDVGSLDRVETQEIGDEREIPDLSSYDEDGIKRVLIEAKFWAELTKNQPNQYLKQLQADRKGRAAALLFVAPRARLETLWPELRRLAEEKKPKFILNDTFETGDLRSASIADGKLRLLLTSWAALLGRMEAQAFTAGDTTAEADIKQLRGLTDRMDGDAYLPLQQEDLKSEFPSHMLDLAQLADDATRHAIKNCWANTEGARATPQRRGYGRYVSIGGVGTWFGIHTEGWARHSDTPLWPSFHETYRENLEQAKLDGEWVEIGGRLCIPMELPNVAEYNKVLNSVVNCLGSFAKLFDPSVPEKSENIDSDFFRQWLQQKVEPEFAKRMLGVAQLVDEAAWRAASRAAEDGSRWANTDGLKKIIHPRREGYGRFIRIGGVKAWLGIHFGAWAGHCDTPLWLVFDHHEGPRLANVTASVHKVHWKHCIPINVPATAEHDEVLETVVDSLKDIAIQLEDSNG